MEKAYLIHELDNLIRFVRRMKGESREVLEMERAREILLREENEDESKN